MKTANIARCVKFECPIKEQCFRFFDKTKKYAAFIKPKDHGEICRFFIKDKEQNNADS